MTLLATLREVTCRTQRKLYRMMATNQSTHLVEKGRIDDGQVYLPDQSLWQHQWLVQVVAHELFSANESEARIVLEQVRVGSIVEMLEAYVGRRARDEDDVGFGVGDEWLQCLGQPFGEGSRVPEQSKRS